MDAQLLGDCLQSAQVGQTPFRYLIVRDGALAPAAAAALARDFPRYRGAGFFPHARTDCGPSINALVAELTAPAFADAVGERLGVAQLSRRPVLVTLCRALNRRHGTVHTDSTSKVVTALLYLNAQWSGEDAGCLRLLADASDIDSLVAPEVRPLYGALVAFRRADNSFHGHLPYEGERRVIQVAWLVDEAARDRKTRRGRASRLVKAVAGRLDRWFGRDRARTVVHGE